MTSLARLRAHMELARAALHDANRVAGRSKSPGDRDEAMRLVIRADRAFNAAAEAFNNRNRYRKEAAE